MEKRNIIDAIRSLDRDTVLKNVVYRMVNRERRAEFLKGAPHREFFDIAAVYSCRIAGDDEFTCRIALSNEMCGHYGISFEELDTAARRNTEAAGFAVYTMGAMWIISNESHMNGASALFYPDLFGRIADQAGCDLYILPSSIHEVIAVRAAGCEPERLSELVQFVNRTEVDEKDYLSDSVYRYCRDNRKIIIEAGQKNRPQCINPESLEPKSGYPYYRGNGRKMQVKKYECKICHGLCDPGELEGDVCFECRGTGDTTAEHTRNEPANDPKEDARNL